MKWLAVLALILLPITSWAQGSSKLLPPAYPFADLPTCDATFEGARIRHTEGASGTDCTTGGGGTTVTCECNGSAWTVSPAIVANSLDSGDIGPRAISESEIGALFETNVIFCGQLANNGTNYSSPISGFGGGILYTAGLTATDLSYGIGGTGCDAEDNATEATADEILFANNTIKVIGLYCQVSSSGSNGVTINLRDDTADLTPDITVTIPTGETSAVAATSTTSDIAAGSAVAIRAITTEDLSAQDVWCQANIVVKDNQ